FAGPKVSVADMSLLGNYFFGCHWAFNVGIIVAFINAQTKVVGGYMEGPSTSYIAPYSSPCVAYGTTSMHNGSGWNVVDTSLGLINVGAIQAQYGKFLNGLNFGRSKPLRGEGNCNGTPFGRSATGVSLGNNGGSTQAWIYCSDAADATANARLWANDLEIWHGGVPGITMT